MYLCIFLSKEKLYQIKKVQGTGATT